MYWFSAVKDEEKIHVIDMHNISISIWRREQLFAQGKGHGHYDIDLSMTGEGGVPMDSIMDCRLVDGN